MKAMRVKRWRWYCICVSVLLSLPTLIFLRDISATLSTKLPVGIVPKSLVINLSRKYVKQIKWKHFRVCIAYCERFFIQFYYKSCASKYFISFIFRALHDRLIFIIFVAEKCSMIFVLTWKYELVLLENLN